MPTVNQASFIWVLLICFNIVPIYGQSIVEILGPSIIDGCDTIEYDLIVRAPQADQILAVRFSEPVTYIENSLTEQTTVVNGGTDGIEIDLSDYEGCNLISGTITIVPDALDFLLPFVAIAYLDDEVDAASETSSFVRRSFVDIDFSPYTFDITTNQVSKIVTITNVSAQTLNELNIEVSIDTDFANIAALTGATAFGDSLITISQEDFGGSGLIPDQSHDVLIQYSLNRCDIQSISYVPLGNCISQDIDEFAFVDDNISDVVEPVGRWLDPNPELFNVGFCDFEFFDVQVFLEGDNVTTPELSEAYDLTISLDRLMFQSNNVFRCMDAVAMIGSQPLEAQIANGMQFLFDLQELTDSTEIPDELQDLDGDGAYDDLAFGDTLIVSIGFKVSELCIDAPYSVFAMRGNLTVNSSDRCDQESISDPAGFSVRSESFIVTSIPSLRLDSRDELFVNEGQNTTHRLIFSNSNAYLDDCAGSEEVRFTIDIPTFMRLADDGHMAIRNGTDTIDIAPVDLIDSVTITLPVADSWVLLTQYDSFCGVAFETAVNCGDCVFSDLQRMTARAAIDCDQTQVCSVPNFRDERSNGPLKVVCADQRPTGQIVQVDTIIVDRLNTQWVDKQRTDRIDPDNYPISGSNVDRLDSLPGNRYFFEGDTLRSRYRFHIDCANMLDALDISLRFQNNNTSTRLDAISSQIVNLATGQKIDVSLLTEQRGQDLTLSLDDVSLFQDGDWQWDLQGVVRMNTQFSANTSYVTQPIRYSTRESSVNECAALIDQQEVPFATSEYFIESLFSGVGNQGISNLSLGRASRFIQTLHSNNRTTSQSNATAEYREYPNMRHISISVPHGYELVDETYHIEAFRIEESDFDIFSGEATLETDVFLEESYSPTSVSMDETHTHYRFDIGEDYNVLPVGSLSFGYVEIIASEVPTTPTSELIISGSILYRDHTGGTLEDVIFDFSDRAVLFFDDYNLAFDDDFMIIRSDSTTIWTLRNGSMAIPSLRFLTIFSGFDFVDIAQDYGIELTLQGIDVDSITIVDEGNVLFTNTTYQANRIDQNTWILNDPLEFFTTNPNILIHTSDFDCGFDTLFVSYQPSNLELSGCDDCIWRDTLISFLPSGFMELEQISGPTQLENCVESEFDYRVENIGEGDLGEVEIFVESSAYAQLAISYLDQEGNYIPATVEVSPSSQALSWRISEDGIDELIGVDGVGISDLDFRISYGGDCIAEEEIDIIVWSVAELGCGDEISSDRVGSTIPVIIGEDRDRRMVVDVRQVTECQDELQIEVLLTSRTATLLSNSTLDISLPLDISYSPQSSRVNGQAIDDPVANLGDQGLELRWDGALDGLMEDSLLVTFTIDIGCTNACMESGFISGSLVSDFTNSCNESCSVRSTRAHAEEQELPLSPDFLFRGLIVESIDVNQSGELTLSFDTEIKQNNSLIYDVPISFDVYHDSNGNGVFDSDEPVLFASDYGLEDFEFTDLVIREMFTLTEDQLCNLVMRISFEDCACRDLNQPVGLNESLGLSSTLYTCGNQDIPLADTGFEECDRVWLAHPRIDQSDPAQPFYRVSPDVDIDTLVGMIDCFGCVITDTVIVINDTIASQLIIIPPDSCFGGVSAELIIDENVAFLEFNWVGFESSELILSNIMDTSITVEFTTDFGCEVQHTASIDPMYLLSNNWSISSISTLVMLGQSIRLELTGDYPIGEIAWFSQDTLFDCEDCRSIELVPLQDQQIFVAITDENGCTQERDIFIDVFSESRVYVPNGFTPNGDGINDFYFPSFNEAIINVNEWSVFDRWGNRMIHRFGPAQTTDLTWDGNLSSSEASEGAYVYRLVVETFEGRVEEYHGSLSLIR